VLMQSLSSSQFSGKTPLLDTANAVMGEAIIDEAPVKKSALLAETHNEFLMEQSFPWTFSKTMESKWYGNVKRLVNVSVTVKRIKYDVKRNQIGFWMTATRDGRSVMTRSPTWFVGCPLHVHNSEIVDESAGVRQTTRILKEDPLGAIMENLLENARVLPFGTPIGDDMSTFWADVSGFPIRYVGGDGESFSDLVTGNGNTTDTDTVYTAISTLPPVINGNYSELDRGCNIWDISSINPNWYITWATVITTPSNTDDALGNIDIGLTAYSPANWAAISQGDYQTSWGENFYESGFPDEWAFDETNHYENLNYLGRNYLNSRKGYNAALMNRTRMDFDNDSTGLTWASDGRSCVSFSADTDVSRLTLTYTVAKPVLSVNRSGANLRIGWTVP